MAENTPIISFRDADILNGEATVIYGLNMDVYPGDFVYIVGKVGTGKNGVVKITVNCLRGCVFKNRVLFYIRIELINRHRSPSFRLSQMRQFYYITFFTV